MLLTATTSSTRTVRFDDRTAEILRKSHEVDLYQECGWHCATGFDADHNVTVMVHANSAQELAIAMSTHSPTHDQWGKRLVDKEGRVMR